MADKHWRKRCPWCDGVTVMRKTQRYCSVACARYGQHMTMSDATRHRVAVTAGKASGKKRRKAAREQALARVENLRTKSQAYELGYQQGYQAGYFQRRQMQATERRAA